MQVKLKRVKKRQKPVDSAKQHKTEHPKPQNEPFVSIHLKKSRFVKPQNTIILLATEKHKASTRNKTLTTQISMEIFPPKTQEDSDTLEIKMNALKEHKPAFVSVTHSAGGSGNVKDAMKWVKTLSKDHVVHAHLTCRNKTEDEALNMWKTLKNHGASGVVALRGDPPKNQTPPPAKAFANSQGFVKGLAALPHVWKPETIIVGAYPEGHKDSLSWEQNIEWLKGKVEAGATMAITQFFFEKETWLRFRDRLAKAQIDIPVAAGILPPTNWENTVRFAKSCQANIPAEWTEHMESTPHENQSNMALKLTRDLCLQLQSEGVERFHIYAMNRPESHLFLAQALQGEG